MSRVRYRAALVAFVMSGGCVIEESGAEPTGSSTAEATDDGAGPGGDDQSSAGPGGDDGGSDSAADPLAGDCAEFLTDDERFPPALAKYFLDLHNAKRAEYCLEPLEWDPRLARVAQQFAEQGAGTLPGHNDDRHAQYAELIGCDADCPQLGENISWHGPWDFWPLETMADGWLAEEEWEPGCNDGGLHYTQMVWQDSTHVGCGAWIDPEDRVHFVCNYLGFQSGPPSFPDENCSCGGTTPVVGEACE